MPYIRAGIFRRALQRAILIYPVTDPTCFTAGGIFLAIEVFAVDLVYGFNVYDERRMVVVLSA